MSPLSSKTNKFLLWATELADILFPDKYRVTVEVATLCPTLCRPMGYTVCRILQARILEWVAFPFSRGSSQPRDRTQVSLIAGRFFPSGATRAAQIQGRKSCNISVYQCLLCCCPMSPEKRLLAFCLLVHLDFYHVRWKDYCFYIFFEFYFLPPSPQLISITLLLHSQQWENFHSLLR